MTDIDKLRELAVKARDTMAEANDCLAVEFRDFVSKHQAAHRALQEMTTHETIISILDALEAANKRIAELETVSSNTKSDIRLVRQIIVDLGDNLT